MLQNEAHYDRIFWRIRIIVFPSRNRSKTSLFIQRLRGFVSERGKITPRRISGSCARHQRQLTRAIRRARTVALVPYTGE